MKRLALVICALGILSFTCFAQDTVPAAEKGRTPLSSPISEKIMKPAVEPLEMKGTVAAIASAEPAKGVTPEIWITGEDGMCYTFLVRPTTTIYSPDWKAITLDKLEKGQQVRMQYIFNKDGISIALSIKPTSRGNAF